MNDVNDRNGLEIAVIGMAGRFPGARDIRQYWENLKNGVETIYFLSPRELEEMKVIPGLLEVTPGIAEDPQYVKSCGGRIEEKESFDAFFFGYTPQEAELLNPGTRIFYQCAWAALENAGYNPFYGETVIGIYAGASSGFNWEALNRMSGRGAVLGEFAGRLLTDENTLCTQISYRFDLKGPAVVVQTACSTSLVAVHMASQALLNGECEMALAGGVTVPALEVPGYIYREGMIYSPDGHCRAFDAKARGMTVGEGAGVVVLKLLETAEAQHDHIYAIIKGTAVNNDGTRKIGYAAPSVVGQAEVVRLALQAAELEPESITYVETHGTGTTLGDPIEIQALARAFETEKKQYCAVGSVKTNIGHLGSAAGIAGLIKTVQALYYRLIPPSLHFENPNPKIDWANTPFFVNTRLREWKNEGYPLRAGVSSLGIGGTNAHIILEERPQLSCQGRCGVSPLGQSRQNHLILLSAKTPTALEKMSENLADYIKSHPGINMDDIAYTLQVGRRPMENRKMMQCSTQEEVTRGLSTPASIQVLTGQVCDMKPPVVFLFPGLGAQYVNMGRELYEKQPLFRAEMDRCFEILADLMETEIKEILYPSLDNRSYRSNKSNNPDNIDLHRPEIAQAAVFILEYSLARMLMEWGIHPRSMIGYSFGEYAAASISGVFSLEDVLGLIVKRGQLLKKISPGVMVGVPLEKGEVIPLLPPGLFLAIDNGETCIVAGTPEAAAEFEARMKARRCMITRLPAERALHTPMMEPILEEFKAAVIVKERREPRIPYVSNLTAGWITAGEACDPRYWAAHLRETVRYAEGIKRILEDPSVLLVEVGPGNDLSALLSRTRTANDEKPWAINLVKPRGQPVSDLYYLLNRVGRLWLKGVPMDWNRFYPGEKPFRIPLPTYPFEGKKYWIQVEPSQWRTGKPAAVKDVEMADRYSIPSWKRLDLVESVQTGKAPGPGKKRWLVFVEPGGHADRLVERLKKGGHEVIIVHPGREFQEPAAGAYTLNPARAEDYTTLFNRLYSRRQHPERIVHFWGAAGPGHLRGPQDPGEIAERFEKAQEIGYYSLLNLVKAMTGRALQQGIKTSGTVIDVVTANMQEVTGEEELWPEKAVVSGLLKVIPQENPGIRCRSIDLEMPGPGTPPAHRQEQEEIMAQHLWRELAAENHETFEPVIALRGTHRWVQIYEPVRLEYPPLEMLPLRKNGIYWITGGLGNIGMVLARDLAKEYKARLVLTGRSALPPREEWGAWQATHEATGPTAVKMKKIQELEALGAEVAVYCADAGDLPQMQEVMRQAEARYGKINGVIHAAGIVRGETFAPLGSLEKNQSREQFQAKVYGLINLALLLGEYPLDFCWLISSISVVLGGLGFGAYASANSFMDAYVNWHRRGQRRAGNPQTPWLSLDWDGTDPAQTAAGILRTLRLAGKGIDRIVVSNDGHLQDRIHRWVNLETLRPESPGTSEISASPGKKYHLSLNPRPPLPVPYAAPRNPVEQTLAELWQQLLGYERVGIQDDFFELGGDSLKALTVLPKIHQRLQVEIPVTEFFQRRTIEKLSAYIGGAKTRKYYPIAPAEKKEYYILSPAQKRLHILQQMEKESIAYNGLHAVELTGGIDPQKVEEAFHRIIQRHECFRTTIRWEKEEYVQQVHQAANIAFKVEYYEADGGGDENKPGIEAIIGDFMKPFDLSKAPFMRAGLVKVGEDRYILVVDRHHIVTDAVSHELFVKELLALYEEKELPAIKLHYKDYAEWQNRPGQQALREQQENYWQEHFRGEIPVIDLPTDFARPKLQGFEGKTVGIRIPHEETRRLKEMAAAEEATLYMALLAIFYLFLAKITGQEDIVIGTGTVGRRHPDLQGIMGLFVNTLAIRNYPNPGKTLRQFLREVKTTTLQAFENQEYPFEDLVDKIKVKRDTSRNPLFDVMLVLQNIHPAQGEEQKAGKEKEIETAAPAPKPAFNIKPYVTPGKIAKFDLTLFGDEVNDELCISVEYSTKLFKDETINLFIAYFNEILAAADPAKTLEEIEKISEKRKQDMIYRLNQGLRDEAQRYKAAVGTLTLQQKLKESFERYKDNIAVVKGRRQTAYGELARRAAGITAGIIKKGIPAQSFIGILIEDREELIGVMIGILNAGSVVVPLDSSSPRGRLETMMKTAGLGWVITDDELNKSFLGEAAPPPQEGPSGHLESRLFAALDSPDSSNPSHHSSFIIHHSPSRPLVAEGIRSTVSAPGTPAPVVTDSGPVEFLRRESMEHLYSFEAALNPPGRAYDPGDSIYIYFTSGTTGTPRAMKGRNQSLLHFLDWEIETFGIHEGYRFSQFTTPVFDAYLRDIFVPLSTGAAICIPPRKEDLLEPWRLRAWVNKSQIGLMHCVPALFRLLKAPQPHRESDYKSLRYILLSGERIDPADLADWYAEFGERIRLVNLWGTSETTLAKTAYFIQPGDINRERIPVGKPLPGASVVVLKENLEICDHLVTGELYIKTPFRTSGYHNEPAINEQRFIPDPFSGEREVLLHKTGDLGRLLPDGNIDVKGRNDRQVKIRGIRVELEEIESLLTRHPAIAEAVVLKKEMAAPTPGDSRENATGEGNEILCAYITLAPAGMPGAGGPAPAEEAEAPTVTQVPVGREEDILPAIKAYVSEGLPDYMVPVKWIRLEKLPRTPRGKVDYEALPDPLAQGKAVLQPPRDHVEEKLLELWVGILRITKENIGLTQTFFELGGNSLNIMNLISQIHREFDVRLSLAEVFNQPTIAGQAGLLRAAAAEKYETIRAVEEREYYPQSSAQKRLFFLDQFEEVGTSYNMSGVTRIHGPLDKTRYEYAFRAVILRHESLRTSFSHLGDMPVQRVLRPDRLAAGVENYRAATREEIERTVKEFIRPFDLAKAPLVRLGLVEIPGRDHLLMFDMHHIISDGTSMRILPRDFTRIAAGEELPPLRLQYKDYSQWQNNLEESGRIKAQEAYWLNLYSGEIPRLDLPLENQPPPVFTFEGERYRFNLEGEEAIELKTFCARNRVTLFMVLLAAYNLLLYKHSGQEDIVVGCDIAGRPHADLQEIIGMFVNMLAMRNYPSPTLTILEFLETVKKNSLEAFENQDVQLENLVDRLNLERNPAKNPLFDVEFLYRDIDRAMPAAAGQTRTAAPRAEEVTAKTSKFDMALEAYERTDAIAFEVEYYSPLFKPETIQLMAEHYLTILRTVKADPGVRLTHLDIMTERERQQVLEEFNNTQRGFPAQRCYYEIFREQAHRVPDMTAVYYGTGEERRNEHIAYASLEEAAARQANYLNKSCGTRAGDRVGVYMDRSIFYLAALLGILAAGGVYVPLEPTWPEERIKKVIDDAGIKVVITREKYLRTLDRLQWQCPTFSRYLCIDSRDLYGGAGGILIKSFCGGPGPAARGADKGFLEKSPLVAEGINSIEEEWRSQEKLWEYIGETAGDEITGGGWVTSYTGEPFTSEEMAEYGDNVLKKLAPILNPRMRVLEIGCATGLTMYRLAPLVGTYYGTDFSGVIIRKNKERVDREGHRNITLACLAAHEIHRLRDREFDLIILNSVIQSFHGHNYLKRVLRQAVQLLRGGGYIFAGDIMDREKEGDLVREMKAFKKANKEKKTKTDFSGELFLSRAFFEDLAVEIPGIESIAFSNKIYTIENELTKFRYDVLISIGQDKSFTGVQGPAARPHGMGNVSIKSFCGGAGPAARGADKGILEKSPLLKTKYQHDSRELARYGTGEIEPGIEPGDLAYIIYTSGTTGQPKGVMIHHRGMINHLYAKIHDLSITSADIVAQTASAGFDISVWQFLVGLVVGGRTVIIDKEVVMEPVSYIRELQRQRVTILESVPSAMAAFLEVLEDKGEPEKELKYMRWMVPTGEALPVHLVREWQRHYPGIKLVNAYGPTEASDDITHYVVEGGPGENQKVIPIGKPLQNLRIYILDENLSFCPVRVRGEICVAGIGVGKGYLNRPELTGEKFVMPSATKNPFEKGFLDFPKLLFNYHSPLTTHHSPLYRTGDIGYWREDGTIVCQGRKDQQVKIRGNRIELGEIENRLARHEDIKEVVVTAGDGAGGEKYLCAYVVQARAVEPEEMRDYLSATLPDYMIPAYFIPLERIPLTPNGKLDRKALPDPEPGEAAAVETAPGNKIERMLAGIWAEVLNIDVNRIGIDDDFFQMGGHSLRATLVNAKIHKRLNVKIPLAEIFKTPTIRGLSRYIAGAGEEIYENIQPIEKREYYPQSSAQKRLFFLEQFEEIGTSYNVPFVYKIHGEITAEHYEKPFRELIARHEAFRTSLLIIGSEPVQRVHDDVDFHLEEIAPPGNKTGNESIAGLIKAFIRPFHLAKAPLLRVGLIRLAEQESLLLFDMHHIISDGTSEVILVREFMRLYTGEELPPLHLQYKDFARWQNRLFKSESIKRQEEYWMNLYAEVERIPVLNLPTDYPRQEVFDFAGAVYHFRLGAGETVGFREMAVEIGATLYMNLMAAFNVLLYMYTGQGDIIVGSGIAGRPHAALQNIIGMFVNTLAIRNYPAGEKTYLEFLKEVKENCLNAFENQDMQFEELVERISPGRTSAGNPLFRVELNVQNYDQPLAAGTRPPWDEGDQGQAITGYAFEHTTSKFDLIFFATEIGDGIHFMVEYSTALFKPATIEKMAQRYKQIIEQVMEDRSVKINGIKVAHDLLEARPAQIEAEFEL